MKNLDPDDLFFDEKIEARIFAAFAGDPYMQFFDSRGRSVLIIQIVEEILRSDSKDIHGVGNAAMRVVNVSPFNIFGWQFNRRVQHLVQKAIYPENFNQMNFG